MARLRTTLLLVASLAVAGAGRAGGPPAPERISLPELTAPVEVLTDALGVPHIFAENDPDAFFVQGHLHARDRFFQMDLGRRFADARLAELVGSFGIPLDTHNRQFGLRRAAERSEALLEPREHALLQGYADGVNAWLASSPLPPEYETLELTSVPPWEVVDTLMLGKAVNFEAFRRLPEHWQTGLLESYQAALGDDAGRALYLEDVFRDQPVDDAATVPDAGGAVPFLATASAPAASPVRRLAGETLQPLKGGKRLTARATHAGATGSGSNIWGVAAHLSATGTPLVVGDGHLELSAPSVAYEIHLVVRDDPEAGPMNVTGDSRPGIPGVGTGQNERVAWVTAHFYGDGADTFRDRLVRDDPACPARFCVDSAGALHPVVERQEEYFENTINDGQNDNLVNVTETIEGRRWVLTVPFRAFGPVFEVEDETVIEGGAATETIAIINQFAGSHGTREVAGVLAWQRARSVEEFRQALRSLTAIYGSYVVADREGNLGYFTSGEIPLRADLESGSVVAGVPWLRRDGSGAGNWIPDPDRSEGQVLPYRVVPFEEMPQVLNPPNGFVVNANNDPVGAALDNDPLNERRLSNPAAIYYVGSRYDVGLRAGRITERLREAIDAGAPLSMSDMMGIQLDTKLPDAPLLVPLLEAAFGRGGAPGAPAEAAALAADPGVTEAVARLAAWDGSAPTGIPEGYDASDENGVRAPVVSVEEAASSVAATLFSVWRATLARSTMVAGLESLGLPFWENPIYTGLLHVLGEDPFTGVGASGIDFFPEPAALPAEDRRDVALLQALRDALDELASPAHAASFARSTSQDDYRWGKLHRVKLWHPLGLLFPVGSVPTAGGFSDLAPQLPGMARDGGWSTVNVGHFDPLARGAAGFTFSGGAVDRLVMSPGHPEAGAGGTLGFNAMPGGSSGDPASPLYMSQLPMWLTGENHRMVMTAEEVDAERTEHLLPTRYCREAATSCPPAPASGCRGAAKGSLSVVEKKPGNEKLTAKLSAFDAGTSLADLGDPVGGDTRYDLCVYGGGGELVGALCVDRGGDVCGPKQKPCWKARGEKGYLYKDSDAAASGVKKLTTGPGSAGKGKLQLQAGNQAKKERTAMPTGLANELEGATSATLQMLVSDGACFEAALATVKKADAARFKAKR